MVMQLQQLLHGTQIKDVTEGENPEKHIMMRLMDINNCHTNNFQCKRQLVQNSLFKSVGLNRCSSSRSLLSQTIIFLFKRKWPARSIIYWTKTVPPRHGEYKTEALMRMRYYRKFKSLSFEPIWFCCSELKVECKSAERLWGPLGFMWREKMREAKPKSLQAAMTLIISLPLKGLLRIISVKKYLENLLFVWLCTVMKV